MTESTDALTPNEKDEVWQFVADNPKIIGFPISDNQGLDLLNALRDVYNKILEDPEMAADMLTMIATVMISAVTGRGNETVEELVVQEAMHRFDKEAKDILND